MAFKDTYSDIYLITKPQATLGTKLATATQSTAASPCVFSWYLSSAFNVDLKIAIQAILRMNVLKYVPNIKTRRLENFVSLY